jgi:hypothetical protein
VIIMGSAVLQRFNHAVSRNRQLLCLSFCS